MTRFVTLGAALLLGIAAQAEPFTIDTGHAEIGFAVKHLMLSNVKGDFNTFSGTLDYDVDDKTLKSAQGTIEVASIDTNNDKRDSHLKSGDFFNVKQYPDMAFQSTSVDKTGENTFKILGKLTVLGVERDVVLPVTITGPINDRRGNQRIGIEAKTVLNRHDLGISNSPSTVIGDEVEIDISLEATSK